MESFFASAEGVRIAIQCAANEPICPHHLNGVKSGIRSQPRKPQGAVTRVAHLGVFCVPCLLRRAVESVCYYPLFLFTDQVVQPDKYVQAVGLFISGSQKLKKQPIRLAAARLAGYRLARGAGPSGLAGLVGLSGCKGREGVPRLGREGRGWTLFGWRTPLPNTINQMSQSLRYFRPRRPPRIE